MSRFTSSSTDAELMALAKKGESEAFAALYGRYWARAVKMATVICGGRTQAKDIVRISFAAAWRNIDEYAIENESVQAWLLGIVRGQAAYVGTGAEQWGQARLDERRDKVQATGSRAEGKLDIASDIAGAIALLLADSPIEQREVIAMAFFGELSPAEIAEQLNLDQAAVEGRVRMGLADLRARGFTNNT